MLSDYKHSRFNVSQRIDNNKYIIFNTLTQGLMEVDRQTFDCYENMKSATDLMLNKFMEYGFWIAKERDEIDELKVRHRKSKFATDRVNVTINTTNNCNFRCVYCYQEQVNQYMDANSSDRVIQFFKEQINQNVNYILIHWFGGEPLLHMDPILKIERFLQTHFIGYFKSQLTTNGYLLNEANIRLLSKTNIEQLQITLDGIESQHNQTRKLQGGQGTFETIIDNIKKCLAIWPGAKIILRININRLNDHLDPLLEFLQQNGLERIRLHISEAKQYNKNEAYNSTNFYYPSTQEYAERLLEIYKSLARYGFPIPMYKFRGYNCDFDCLHNFIIDTDTKIYQCKCEGVDSPFYMGEINDQGLVQFQQTNVSAKLLREPFSKEECLQCKVLPMCMGGCNYLEHLGRDACIPEKYILDEVVSLYYFTHL